MLILNNTWDWSLWYTGVLLFPIVTNGYYVIALMIYTMYYGYCSLTFPALQYNVLMFNCCFLLYCLKLILRIFNIRIFPPVVSAA